MGQFTRQFIHQIGTWDGSAKVALALDLVLIVVVGGIVTFGPSDVRQSALIGLIALLVMLQLIVLWGNRGMVTPYTQAQRHFMAGEFDQARAVLEAQRAIGKVDANALTLLGNVYRQLGFLEQSEQTLKEALKQVPLHYFPLYGFGRTLFAIGNYAGAIDYIQRALDAGAPDGVRFDLGHALYRSGDLVGARQVLEHTGPYIDEPFRRLMLDYLLQRLDTGRRPSVDDLKEGLPYWRAEAQRFRHTPYGVALAVDIQNLEALMEETNT